MKTVTFGELMLRLSPESYNRFVQADKFCVTFGGAEANVAADLAFWGERASFATKLPAHEIGRLAADSLRKCGVDTSAIVYGGERIGVYYTESGASQRGGKVIYDRKHSAFAEAEAEEFDWNRIFADASWLHVTGITPALSAKAAESAAAALKAAKKRGLTISFDPNYRSTLWNKEKAAPVLRGMTKYADVLITNVGQAADIYGLAKASEETAKTLAGEYGCRYVALTDRKTHSAFRNDFSASLFSDGVLCRSRSYEMELVDRLGGGDAFAAGLIYALSKGFSSDRAAEFAAAAGALKHSVAGDYAFVSVEEIEALANGCGLGEVRR